MATCLTWSSLERIYKDKLSLQLDGTEAIKLSINVYCKPYCLREQESSYITSLSFHWFVFVLLQLLLEESINSSAICQEVSDFVELIWAEALGHLDSLLLESVNNISLNDVS